MKRPIICFQVDGFSVTIGCLGHRDDSLGYNRYIDVTIRVVVVADS